MQELNSVDEGKSYTETFAAAAKTPSVQVVLANVACQDCEIHHVDIKSTYLNAPLKEMVYMKPPPRALKPGEEGKVCRLLKGIYGLHQAGRRWYKEMSRVLMQELEFKRSAVDQSVFYFRNENEHTIIVVAMDNMAITSKRLEDIVSLKKDIQKYWKISDMGKLKWYLCFRVQRDQKARTIAINQQFYINVMLEKFRLTLPKPVSMPIKHRAKLSKDQSPATPM